MQDTGFLKLGRSVFEAVSRRVRGEISRRSLLPRSSRVLVAVSGGQDSLALAELLRTEQNQTSPWACLSLAHTDHAWPGDEGCAEHVAAYASRVSLDLHIARAAGSCSNLSEAGAREWRYNALSEMADVHNYTHIVVGHTQSDLAETFLFNLVHGAGADGLSSLTWTRDMHRNGTSHGARSYALQNDSKLVRPLLSVSRGETAALCKERKVDVWIDRYNSDPRYARFRTREHVLPYLRAHYNARVEQALARTAHLLRDEANALEEIAIYMFDHSVRVPDSAEHCSPRQILIDTNILRDSTIAVQRRVMRRVLAHHIGATSKKSVFRHVESLIGLIGSSNGSSIPSLPRGSVASVCDNVIVISVPPMSDEPVAKELSPSECEVTRPGVQVIHGVCERTITLDRS